MKVQHVFVGSGPGFRCLAPTPGSMVSTRCGLPVDDPVHVSGEREDLTMVMQVPVSEPVPVIPGQPVLDAPAEDGGGGDGEWSVDDTVRMALGSGPPFGEREIGGGPWPLRQFVISPLGLAAVHDLIDGLWLAGLPFDVYAWWLADGQRRVVRVVWGEFLGLNEMQIEGRMERWPEL